VKKKLIIGQHLPKLWAIKYRVVFYETLCTRYAAVTPAMRLRIDRPCCNYCIRRQINIATMLWCQPLPGVKNRYAEFPYVTPCCSHRSAIWRPLH